jgi:hypothetical protein
MIRRLGFTVALVACTLLVQGGTAWAGMITITPVFAATATQLQKDLYADAIREWTMCLMAPDAKTVTLTINVTFKDLGVDQGGGTSNIKADANGLPKSADMDISTNAIMYYGFGLPVPADKKDALSVMKHELGHALGFAGGTIADGLGYDKWNAQIAAGSDRFNPGGLNVKMDGIDENGRSHLDPGTYPNDLMVPSIGLGNRRMPSDLDFQMLVKAFGYEYICPEPSSLSLTALGTLSLLGYRWRRRNRAAAA